MGVLGAFLRTGFDVMVRRRLRGVWLRGELPGGGFVWAANHHGWWDAFVAVVMLWRRGRRVCVLVDPESLAQHGYLRHAGALGTHELRAALARLRAGEVVVIFPEGELRAAGPVGPLAGGAAWLARRAPAPLVAVATRVTLRGHQAPEAYLSLRPCRPDALEAALREEVAELDAELQASDPRAPLPGFARVLAGRRSAEERLPRRGTARETSR
ncbi:MAG: 1-acyl-sn-glycerol-3-phosphate acyltransferase [Trueperaceae bacterium]|nr:1-acyl-sn-glycerol-3-phosphate acyltransferase [Trueperaceae bacterium]MDZ7799634.1 1-acyl-sn-glycerol-3-phosphate acyltransferase [Trueperaceae bacterium]